MAAFQSDGRRPSISFKSRKKTELLSSKSKLEIENQDIVNIGRLQKTINLKSQQEEDSPTNTTRKTVGSSVAQLSEAASSFISRTPDLDPPKTLTGREKEIEHLEKFLMDCLETDESASLYISGQPGTGKTASLFYILQLPKVQESYKLIYVNCTMMKSAFSIYDRICKELQLEISGTTEKICISAIENYLCKKHKMILLVLDELDQLDSKRQSVLYKIFEWPALERTRIVLIGVANALDLTERILPRLQARCSLRPHTLHFAPYTKEQIISIFTRVLASEDKTKIFSSMALQMLAGTNLFGRGTSDNYDRTSRTAKIAAVSGDMRRALDIGRRVIDVAQRTDFAKTQSVNCMMQHSTVTVELKQVLEVLNDVYGGFKKIKSDVEEGFPMQQKLILCSLMLMLTKGNNKDIIMKKLHDVYKRVAAARNIAPLDFGEMAGACSLLEARGAVRFLGSAAAATRARRVRLQWDETELGTALRDKPLLSAILADDVGCLQA